MAGVFSGSYVEGSFDKTAWNEGKRAVGMQMLAEIEEVEPGFLARTKEEMARVQVAATDDDEDPVARRRRERRFKLSGTGGEPSGRRGLRVRTEPEPEPVEDYEPYGE